MICRAKKSDAAKGRVLFINAVKDVTRKNAESYLEPAHVQKIVDAYKNRTSDGVFSYDATETEIAENGYNLNISRYAHQSIVTMGGVVSLDAAIAEWNVSDESVLSGLEEMVKAVR